MGCNIIRACTPHPLHPITRKAFRTLTQKHRSPISNALRIFELDPHKFETVAPDTTPSYHTPHFKTLIHDTREDSIDTEARDTPDIKIFTDGSGHNGEVGASAVLYKKGEPHEHSSLTLHLGKLTEHTTYEAEAVGALLATWLLRSIPSYAQLSATIYTDNQALIRSLSKRTSRSGHYIVDAIRAAANISSESLQISWISGHS